MKPSLIIVSGWSCTGKTTLANQIGKRFSLPVFGRDDFKESLFDSLGYGNRQRSKQFGLASYQLLYLATDKILAAGRSVVIESNFKVHQDTERLKNLKDKYHCSLLQIHCYAPIALALARFKARSLSGDRHPGHVDHLISEEMEANWKQGGYEIVDICDRTLRVDATNFAEINYEDIYQWLKDNLC
ncbi:AAA family ATPase [Pleurocapsales cyanobacterium LEGE 10410]|nr:AAA family ATPase [Pleurocapsales cyanobacterium LEGE 10410]